MQTSKNKKQLGLIPLIMIAVVSVDSLRNLPISAQYGFSLVTFYLVAGLAFFLPLTWIASKLTASYPNTGGSYVWIAKAFGSTWGNLSVWLQWVYNIIWYPTIFAFINATLAAVVAPGLETSKTFILISSLVFFWLLTLLHCLGIRAVSWISTFGAIVGTLFPMLLMMGLAIYWLVQGHASATPFSFSAFIPDAHNMKNLAFFSNILFSLLGLEIISMHAGNVANARSTYPKAFYCSAFVILLTTVLSSLALCVVLPSEKIGLIDGLMNVFNEFFVTHQIPYGTTFIGVCIIIGGLAIASSWMIGLARGLHTALNSIKAPLWLQKTNRYDMPANVLIMQACVYTILLSAFLLLPNLNQSYWILSALTAQFALLYYVLLFLAAGKLLRQNKLSAWDKFLSRLLPTLACSICLIGITVGFLPPEQIATNQIARYELFMLSCFIGMIAIPMLIARVMRKNIQLDPVLN